jgi:hypothetical protein
MQLPTYLLVVREAQGRGKGRYDREHLLENISI